VLEYVDMDLKDFLNTRESPLDKVVVKVKLLPFDDLFVVRACYINC
jgi:hypothetical protein